MSTTSQTSDSLYSKESFSTNFIEVDAWIGSFQNEKASLSSSSTTNFNPKLNAEIHLAITTESSEYAPSLCDHLFTLYRDAQQRSFVLQFLPSFIIAYYDVLYHHPESTDVTKKDVCSTINTFLVGLYNLSVLDDGHHDKAYEFRIPNLTIPSIYHTPNPDHYAPTPLTQHAISKHEKKCEVVRLHAFVPFDTVNATTRNQNFLLYVRRLHFYLSFVTFLSNKLNYLSFVWIIYFFSLELILILFREQIIWFLLLQYGASVSSMDLYSRKAYFKMTKKLIGQGFSFDEKLLAKVQTSILPDTGRRIPVSSRMMSEILGTLFYFKANSVDEDSAECMHILKKRAEYEIYADVILMTESMSYLHEFENHRFERQDTIGIEIELPPTIDMVKQKRSATTTRSMKNRHRSRKTHQQQETAIIENDLPNETIEHLNFVPVPSKANPTELTPPTSHRHKSISDILHENTPSAEFIRSTSTHTTLSTEKQNEDISTSMNDTLSTNITSSVGPATSSPSPPSPRHYKPISLTSTQTYFNTLQQQRSSSPNMQHVQTIVHSDDAESPRPRTSSMKHGEKKEMYTTVRFICSDGNQSNGTETFL